MHLLKDVPMVNPGVVVSAPIAHLVTTALIQQAHQSPVPTVQTAQAPVNTSLISALLATLVLAEPEPHVMLEISLWVQQLPVPPAHQATCAPPLMVLLNYVLVELSQNPLLSHAPSALPLEKHARLSELLLVVLLLMNQIVVLVTTEFTLAELPLLTDA